MLCDKLPYILITLIAAGAAASGKQYKSDTLTESGQ